ncbi:MAG: hypothetical protein FJX62_02670 [Alphaproteobacteria bacterium]|nr:hypothetical protein [Alphaproteobacteria bacterium]
MRVIAFAALAVAALAAPQAPASAQPFTPEHLVPEPAAATPFQIVWEVRNRFRLFRNEADFRRHVEAHRAGGVLDAERKLALETGGRGWARDMIGNLCVDIAGAWLDTCPRDGARENYLAPADHAIAVRLGGEPPADAVCNWRFEDGDGEPQQASTPCREDVRLRVRHGKPTVAAVGVVRPDGGIDSATAEIKVRDVLIAGLGDSVAAGEGNPDVPVALADDGFCFRRFLGTVASEYFRPSRAGFAGDRACGDDAAGPGAAVTAEWARHGARWLSAACHRSLYGYQMRTALALAVENPQIAVTFLPLACTGAEIEAGLFASQGASECPPRGACAGSVPAQLTVLRNALAAARKLRPDRALDLVLLTVGANDIKFSGLVADVIITSGVERLLFNQGGLIASLPQAQRLLDRDLPSSFAKLRTALKPMVGGNLARVVYVPYGNPAMQDGTPCPGGRSGLDVHPAFSADGAKLRQVGAFVSSQFLPRLRALARCEAGVNCRTPDTDRMTFADLHQDAFTRHGFCVRADTDPEFDRACFSEKGESFDADPVSAANSPLACPRRPSEFRPYASRARWIRTANDSYFAAMTFPRALPVTMQPSNIHDASWGALSAVYGGAIHPTAEGHAVMADAALTAVREVLGLKAPPEIVSKPLPPPVQ